MPDSAFARAAKRSAPLAAILIAGAALRLVSMQFGQYGSDDERLWVMALTGLDSGELPIQGIKSSIGIGNGPFQVYLMMIPAAISRAPIVGSIAVGLLNVAGLFFLYAFVKEFLGRRPALIATLLFAFNSWAVIYSRRMQAQDLLVPFQILFFWSAARWLVRGKGLDLVLTFLWLAVLSQVYILGMMHFASMGLILLLGWRRLRPIPLAIGAAIWGVLSFEYLGTIILRRLDAFTNVSSGGSHIDADSLGIALTMATHKGFQTIAGQAGGVLDSTSGIEGFLVYAEAAIFLAGIGYLGWVFYQAIKTKNAPQATVYAVLATWVGVPILLFTRHSIPLYPYYYVALVPLPAVLTALLIDRFWPRGGWPALGLLTANSALLAGIFFAVIPGYYTHNDYGLPYQYTIEIANRVEELVRTAGADRVYVDGDMDPSDVMSSLLKRSGLNVFWFDDYRTPEFAAPPAGAMPAVYLTMGDDTRTAQFMMARFATEQRYQRQLPGEGVVMRAYVLTPEAVRAALSQTLTGSLDLKASNGATLTRYQFDRRLTAGKPLQAAIGWTWPGGPRPDQLRYSLFAHLVDSTGKSWGQVDSPLLTSVDWLAGEEVVQWVDIAAPENLPLGQYSLDVGVYAGDGTIRQPLTDSAGKQIGSSVTLGPIALATVTSAVPPLPAGSKPTPFDDGINLLGQIATSQNGKLSVDLRWQASKTPSKDYTVYVHLTDSSGKLIAQSDSQPRDGQLPTGVWLPNEMVDDVHSVAAPPGHYTAEVGLYYLPTLERLPGGPARFDVDVS